MKENDQDYELLNDEKEENKDTEEKKKIRSQDRRKSLNLSDEEKSFLGFYTPKNIETKCFNGADLTTGMKVVCIFLIFELIFNFFRILQDINTRGRIIGIIMSVSYLVATFYVYNACSGEMEQKKADLAYKIFMVVFFMDIGFNFFDILYVMITDPNYFFSFKILGLFLFYTLEFITFVFELYMLWITFCYMVNGSSQVGFLAGGLEGD